jgi:GNAT superfamily N-acetyltransferase
MSDTFQLTGYFPGVIGEVVRLHAQYYSHYWGFDVSFEIQVASESAKFFEEFNADRDGFWAVIRDQRFVGSIAVDGKPDEGSRIRWFILEPDYQGQGLGGLLIDSALKFCRERNLNTIFLWTFKGLDSAAQLYTSRGFKLEIEHEVAQWGSLIIEQKYVLDIS